MSRFRIRLVCVEQKKYDTMYAQDLQQIATNQSLQQLLEPVIHEVKLLSREVIQLKKALVKARAIKGEPEFLSAREVAADLGYSQRTINKWCSSGRIMAQQACYSGSWRIPVSEVERLKTELQGVPIKPSTYQIVE